MSDTPKEINKPPRKKAGRKKVAKKNLAQRPKSRGRYRPNKAKAEATQLTRDLAECIFSDEEERNNYIQETWGHNSEGSSASQQPSSDNSEVEKSADKILHESSPPVSTVFESDSSLQSSTADSRPCSSFSRPGSVIGSSALDSPLREHVDVGCVCAPPYLNPPFDLIKRGIQAMKTSLPSTWITLANQSGFQFLLFSSKSPKAIQREVFVSFSGYVLMYIHCALVPAFRKLFDLESKPCVEFREVGFEDFCNFCVNLTKHFLQYEVCVGANDNETKQVWSEISGGYIDSNPYKEESYGETFRSLSCARLVELRRGKRCKNCITLLKKISKRNAFLLSPIAAPSTSNKNLTKQEASFKLDQQGEAMQEKETQIAFLRSRYRQILEGEGCNLDEDMNNFFSKVLSSSKLSTNQQMFLNEQWSCSKKSDSRAHRWHPSMIRFALHLYIVSNAGYESLRESLLIKLPCARTLYDYSHAIKAQNGVNKGLIQLVHNSVQKLPESYQHYHNLFCNGLHILQNLVFRGSDGSLVGVICFDEIDKEIEVFERYVESTDAILSEPQFATEILAYMVKGVASDVICAIAAIPCKVLTKAMLYKRTWEVIDFCEKAGIKILSFVCDGSSVNRAFFLMHQPWTRTDSGLVFDTINFCSPQLRPLFFLSNVCDLVKTIRNCLCNSEQGEKRTTLMQMNGEQIVWKTIVQLYMTYKDCNFRKSYKLNLQIVFPGPFAGMRVRYSAQALINRVPVDLEAQNWEGTGETVRFIRLCDRFFDVLNGDHSSQAKCSLKPDIAPYTSVDDPQFEWLEHTFLTYFLDWKSQVDSMAIDAKAKDKMMLSNQTLIAIEITIRAFFGAVKHFVDSEKLGGKFIMARSCFQDPLEQEFRKQRAGGGGSLNPNAAQFQSKMVSLTIQRDLGVRREGGNVSDGMTLSEEPLPKRARTTKENK